MKILVVDHAGSFSLVPKLKEKIAGKHAIFSMANVCTRPMMNTLLAIDPDVILCEWGDANAAELSHSVSNRHLKARIPLVVRLHGYESHDWFVNRIAWQNVDKLVVVSPYFERLLLAKVGDKTSVVRIENGVDLDRFRFRFEIPIMEHGVAWAGYLNMKKGPALLKCVMTSMPHWRFDVAGKYQCENTSRLLDDIHPNFNFVGWKDTAEFFPGHRWVLSTSVTESFSYAVAEGMACGLTPLVFDWPGASELWPEECCWNSIGELRAIEPKDPLWCRRWIEERYSADLQIDRIVKLLESVAK
jgi:glycosyltransferase involved in cell wall biosynthesis